MSATNEVNIDLGACPCGEQANWYRVSALPQSPVATSKSVGSITLDDVTENLCDGCYRGFTGGFDEAMPGWKRVDVLRRQSRAGEDDQSRSFDGGDSQLGPDDDW